MVRRINSDILTRFEDRLGKWREAGPAAVRAVEASRRRIRAIHPNR
jgi:hypothetical protein